MANTIALSVQGVRRDKDGVHTCVLEASLHLCTYLHVRMQLGMDCLCMRRLRSLTQDWENLLRLAGCQRTGGINRGCAAALTQ